MPRNKSTLEKGYLNDIDWCYKMIDNHLYIPTTTLDQEKRERNGSE